MDGRCYEVDLPYKLLRKLKPSEDHGAAERREIVIAPEPVRRISGLLKSAPIIWVLTLPYMRVRFFGGFLIVLELTHGVLHRWYENREYAAYAVFPKRSNVKKHCV